MTMKSIWFIICNSIISLTQINQVSSSYGHTTHSISDTIAKPGEKFKRDSIQYIDELGEVSYNEYSEKALHKTENLSSYLQVICDKSSEIDDVNKAMKGALELFVNEDVWVEVSSKNKGQIKRIKIRDYLNHLKLLNYQKVEIQWMNIQYVSKLHKGPDENYYGVITFEQEFRGLTENTVLYSDRTRKNVEVMLKTLPVSTDGKTIVKFDVLLSNIGVVETK